MKRTKAEIIALENKVKPIKDDIHKVLSGFRFEPLDGRTFVEITTAIVKVLKRHRMHDYAVVCDGNVNTPESINEGELRVDVALQFKEDAEFIYLPICVTSGGKV